MRLFKLILISAIVLFGAVTFISLLLPSKVLVSRAVDITAEKDSIKLMVANIDKWQQWMSIDSTGILQYDEAANSLSLNRSTVTVKATTDTSFITIWSNGNKADNIESTQRIITMNSNTVTVQWQMVQHINWYPWEKFSSMLNDKILGSFMEQSLANLKAKTEKH